MTAGQTVSVIICAYTEARWEHTVAAVESIRQQSTPAHEIILAIDHNQRLFDRARSELSDVITVESSGPRGLSAARNAGVAVATGDVVAFLDDDAVAMGDWLTWLLAGYRDSTVLGVGGAIHPLWEGTQPDWFPEEFNWIVACTYRGLPEETAPVRNFIGANMSFHRMVFEQVGGFHTGIGKIGNRAIGAEDTELCIRIHQHSPNGVLLYEPRAAIYHRVPATRANWRYFLDRCYAEGLGKASVSASVGTRDGLAAETAYTLRTLPTGVLMRVAEALFKKDPTPLKGAAAIVSGLAVTTTGYVHGRLRGLRTMSPGSQHRQHEPILSRSAVDRRVSSRGSR